MQPILTNATSMLCPHGGRIAVAERGARVFAAGTAILTVDAVALIEDCARPMPGTCVTARWSAGSTRVFIGGQPALLAGSPGLCCAASDAPQGPVGIGTANARVFAL